MAVSGGASIPDAFPGIPLGIWRQRIRQANRVAARRICRRSPLVAARHRVGWGLNRRSADGDGIAGKLEDTFAVLGQMDDAHPKFRHWYLPWFGVDAAVQGRGLGGALMQHCLEVMDKDHLPAYLDSPNPRNVSFYERHGFVVTRARLKPERAHRSSRCSGPRGNERIEVARNVLALNSVRRAGGVPTMSSNKGRCSTTRLAAWQRSR